MAEGNAAPQGGGESARPAAQGQKPTLFIALAIVNMLVVLGVGVMLYLGKKAQDEKLDIEEIIRGEEANLQDDRMRSAGVGTLVPLETFLVNLAGSRGRNLAKVNMELEVNNADVQLEVDRLKPKIRDMIIIILSGKTFAEVSTREGKDNLREEIRDQVNLFLTQGQIVNVYFTEFIFN